MSSVLYSIVTGLAWLLGLPWKLAHSIASILETVNKNLNDPYFIDFHSKLNDTDSDHRRRPQTEWINMGYWKDTADFPTACEALALRLISAAACKPKGVVLDVGHGCGDSLLLHLQHPLVPRPRRLFGITSQAQHFQRALERTAEHNPDSVAVYLTQGDAVYRRNTLEESALHPLHQQTCKGTYTSILALDCAYHFHTRRLFLEQSFTCLAAGGRIALGDICFSPGSLTFSTRVMVALMGSMPRENVISTDEYVAMLREIGYVDVVLEDITGDVFPGFIAFLKGRGLAFRVLASHFERLVGRGMRFVVVSGAKP